MAINLSGTENPKNELANYTQDEVKAEWSKMGLVPNPALDSAVAASSDGGMSEHDPLPDTVVQEAEVVKEEKVEAQEPKNYSREQRQAIENAEDFGFKGLDARQTGFGENFESMAMATIAEDLTISKTIAQMPHRDQISRLQGMLNNGEVPEKVAQSFVLGKGRYDYAGLGDYLNAKGDTSILTRSQLDADMKDGLDVVRNRNNDISSRAGLSGQTGAFAGGMAASMVDPVNFVAVPAKAITATSLLGRLAQRAAVGAGQAAAVEPIVQGMVHSWKQEIGQEYGIEEMLMNAGMSIAAGGALSGVGGVPIDMWSMSKAKKAAEVRIKDMDEVLDKAVKQGDVEVAEVAADAIEGAELVRNEFENSPADGVQAHVEGVATAEQSAGHSVFDDGWGTADANDLIGPAADVAVDIEAVAPKQARLSKPKPIEGELEADYEIRLAEAMESRDARQALFNQEADRQTVQLREEAQVEAKAAEADKLAPMSESAGESATKAYEALEAQRHGDDPVAKADAENFAKQTTQTRNIIEKSKKFAECMR